VNKVLLTYTSALVGFLRKISEDSLNTCQRKENKKRYNEKSPCSNKELETNAEY